MFGRLLLAILALGTLAALGAVWMHDADRTGRSLLGSALERLRRDPPEFPGALHDLELALEYARREADENLARDVYLLRAGVYEERFVDHEALADYLHVLEHYSPGDPDVLLKVARLDIRREDYEHALDIADQVLLGRPKSSEGLNLRARSLFMIATERVELCGQMMDDVLADQQTATGMDLAWRAAALNFGDTRRAAYLGELETLVGGGNLYQIIAFELDQATAELVAARQAFADSLEEGPRADSIYGLVQLFERASRSEEVADLGLAALVHPEFQTNMSALEALVRVLEELGRPEAATLVIDRAQLEDVVIPVGFLPSWCSVLYRAERWDKLDRIASRLIMHGENNPLFTEFGLIGRFYSGLALVRMEKYSRAASHLSRYLRPRRPPEIAGIESPHAMAWYLLAQAQRGLTRTRDERIALENALRFDPEIDGEAWLRLSEIQGESREPLSIAAKSLTYALQLLPERSEELMPHWRDLSERAMLEKGRQAAIIKQNMRKERRFIPGQPLVPYEWFRIGELYVEERNWYGAERAFSAFLAEHPLFVAALDQLIEVQLERGLYDQALDLLFERVEKVGPHPETLRIIGRLPEDLIDSQQRIFLMAYDPKNTGLLSMIDELRKAGRDETVQKTIRTLNYDVMQDETLLLAARIHEEGGNWSNAYNVAARVGPRSPLFSRSLTMRVRAALEMRPDQRGRTLERAVAAFVEAKAPEPAEALKTVEALILAGYFDEALAILERLDAATETRVPDVLAQLAVVHLLRGELGAAAEDVERADAFLSDGTPEIGRVVLAVRNRRWERLPALVGELRRSELALSELAEVLALALEERVDEAAALAAHHLRSQPNDPRWFLVLAAANALLPQAERRASDAADPYPTVSALFVGTPDEERDPRDVLVLLLAHESPRLSGWVQSYLRSDPTAGGGLWRRWLEAELVLERGEDDLARPMLKAIVRAKPLFRWAWHRLGEIELRSTASPLAGSYLELLELQLAALGPESATRETRALVESHGLQRAANPEGAMAALTPFTQGPDRNPLHLAQLARLQKRVGSKRQAVVTWSIVFDLEEPGVASGYVPEFLALTRDAYDSGAISRKTLLAELEALANHLPRDPLVALARAQRAIDEQPDNHALGVNRAWHLLDDFREDSADVSIESLRSGAARQWFDLAVRHDPLRAEAFVREELEFRPGSLELWLMLGEGLEAQGKKQEALEQYERLIHIYPDLRAVRRAGTILADQGGSQRLVQATIESLHRTEGGAELDPTLEYLRARSLANSSKKAYRDVGIRTLGDLWQRRGEIGDNVDSVEVGQRYAIALLHRGDHADSEIARRVLDAIHPAIEDPLRRDLVAALSHLARWVPEPEPGSENGEEVEETAAGRNVDARRATARANGR
ncbi:MAG: hypothetical protein O7B99_13110 [Planctomycetota bacterium]|nr:hypothetical protein [Planctomycetota bacterium]